MQSVIKMWFVLVMVISTGAWAHGGVKLSGSQPADSAMLSASPKTLALNYSKPLRLMKVSLSGKQHGDVEFGFSPAAEKRADFSWDLPLLAPDTYTVEWIAMGADGHKIKAAYTFMVH